MNLPNWIQRVRSWLSRNGFQSESRRVWAPASDVGIRGEDLAATYLTNQGHQILKRNFKRTWGEIDLVTLDGETVVYVEVKTRRSRTAQPERAVNHAKQKQLIKLARSFASQYKVLHRRSRFDIVTVNDPESKQPVVRHFKNAFRASEKDGVFSRDH